jgi:ATP-dependent exoDNAse (exonuclease V) beta subunit
MANTDAAATVERLLEHAHQELEAAWQDAGGYEAEDGGALLQAVTLLYAVLGELVQHERTLHAALVDVGRLRASNAALLEIVERLIQRGMYEGDQHREPSFEELVRMVERARALELEQ